MGTRVLQVKGATAEELRRGIAAIQQEQGLRPDFPPRVQQAAEEAASRPSHPSRELRRDLTAREFLTIDPAGAMDLDQAMHLETDGDGYVVHYAIADVMAFVEAGDPVDRESHERGESPYGADGKVPLHPKVLSEDAASLLPGAERAAFVWTIRLDSEGAVRDAVVERPTVRSRQKLAYESVQRAPRDAAGRDMERPALLADRLRSRRDHDRGQGRDPAHAATCPGPRDRTIASYGQGAGDRLDGLEICAALCAGAEVPQWVLAGLPDLPDLMRQSGRRANAYENAVIDLVEAETLQTRVGERFPAVVTETEHGDERTGTVMLREPAVEARVSSESPLPVGEDVTVTLSEADPARRRVRFTL